MGRRFRTYLAGEVVFCCKQCGNHLAVSESIMSRAFSGQHGRAILVHDAVNVYVGEAEERLMRTGNHTVRDIYCKVCHTVLGWRYDLADPVGEKYKEGKFILERELIVEKPEPKPTQERVRIEEVIVQQVTSRG